MSNVGKWDRWYSGLREPQAYGDTETYQIGADFLKGLAVEDWGCGKGWFSKFIPEELYRGIDGSATPFADEVVDLVTYRSKTPGLYMRHILEHNYEWKAILENALASFTKRMALVTFTPFEDVTQEIAYAPDPGVPDISFGTDEFSQILDASGAKWKHQRLTTATQYRVEDVFLLER